MKTAIALALFAALTIITVTFLISMSVNDGCLPWQSDNERRRGTQCE
jgi:hypothetical protein